MSAAMNPISSEYWPWIAVVSLGLFHGVNPAMGWLFAVALGLHRRSQKVVLMSLVPIALGHAAAVCAVVIAVLTLGAVLDTTILARLAGITLLLFAGWHAMFGHRGRLRVGMQSGLIGLLLWSFLMANAHGAGVMLVPAVIPICLSASATHYFTASGSVGITLAAVGIHTIAMLAMIATIALATYKWVGVAFLRRGWVNLDIVWTLALIVCGIEMLIA
jgi:hypothetical protein